MNFCSTKQQQRMQRDVWSIICFAVEKKLSDSLYMIHVKHCHQEFNLILCKI